MKFYIKQKVFTFKDQFNIFDENQNAIYQVKGKFISISNKLDFIDKNENVILKAQKKILAFLPKYFIYDHDGVEVATVKRLFSIRPTFELFIKDRQYNVSGDFFAHSFDIDDMGNIIASIRKKYISWGDTYEIDVASQKDLELMLFLVVIIDQVSHEKNHNNH